VQEIHQKLAVVTLIHVRLTVDGVLGVVTLHARMTVEPEDKQNTDNVTILLLSGGGIHCPGANSYERACNTHGCRDCDCGLSLIYASCVITTAPPRGYKCACEQDWLGRCSGSNWKCSDGDRWGCTGCSDSHCCNAEHCTFCCY